MNTPPTHVPDARLRILRDEPPRGDGAFVLYWMNAYRRTHDNFALDRAVDWAKALKKPLVVLEALRVGYPWASDRLHRFVLEGMAANAAAFEKAPVTYYSYVEPSPGEGRGLFAALAARAAVAVTDYFPAFFLPRAVAAAAAQCPVRFEQVDSVGLLPTSVAPEAFKTAHAFRRFLQRELPKHLADTPRPSPLSRLELPRLGPRYFSGRGRELTRRWPTSTEGLLDDQRLAALPIDHAVGRAPMKGGAAAGEKALTTFLARNLPRYEDDRNQPDEEVTSGLSPYLHFGHVSSHRVVRKLLEREGWSPERLAPKVSGSREGWWGVGSAAEAFLDQIVTWRELGFNFCTLRDDYDRYSSLPEWARASLDKHASDPRPERYTPRQLEAAETADELWNAAQRQLVTEGRLHNYMRMLWGKKILQWTKSPREALAVLIDLNNKYALDGRDPNSYSGIFWTLGRYDRPWGPERPIFGVIRYMTSESARRKLHLKAYLERYAA